jgi:phospholipase/carboxylesterase
MVDLNCIEIETNATIDAAVIWLHGLGASGEDFVPIVPELKLPVSAGVRFIFPNAPEIPVTVNGGYIMPAWYDILSMDIDRQIDDMQLLASAHAVSAIIDREISRGINSKRIIIAGFSQGGAVSYQVALTYSQPLGGLIGMSTYFATADSIKPHQANTKLPIHLYHGTADPVVPELLGQKAKAQLESIGYTPAYSTYPMDHSVCLEEIEDIARFLCHQLGL